MKKGLITMFIILTSFLLTGCGKYSVEDLVKDFSKKVNDSNSYKLDGILEIVNNDDTYSYDVNVSYKKENNFKVSLKNKINNYEQIILRNNDGIYVLTPSLNKSFKFQSEWPYNSSQSYLLQTILKDMENNEELNFEQTNDGYIVETKANYSSNKELVNQKIYFDKEKNVYKIEVFDQNNVLKMKMTISNIEYNSTFDDNYFDLNKNMDSDTNQSTTGKTIDEIIYPMYMPQNTYLSSEDKVSKENGERIIMTFAGDNSFILIQETANVSDVTNLIPVNGEPYLLTSAVASVTENSIEWVSNGIEYYLASDDMSKEDLISVAKSLSPMAVTK
ncbi:MAG: hypothetical protein NC181_02160 [Clostridium sp.]|nr:hypothetical protein [Clostridium sp.]MCM1443688.1 hypothetical protein [Candidatus Amulumruptor caecigallinarius]